MTGFKVVVDHDTFENPPIITFELKVVSEDDESHLHSYTLQHKSFDYGMRFVEAYKKEMLQSKVLIVLMAKDIGKILGFEVDLSKGMNAFFVDMASHIATEDLELYLKGSKYEPLTIILENEIKKRKD